MFPGFLTPVLTQLFFPEPPTTFPTCFCRGERRKYAGKKSCLNRGSNCVIRTKAVENGITIGKQGKKGPYESSVRIFFLMQEMHSFHPLLVRLCQNDC